MRGTQRNNFSDSGTPGASACVKYLFCVYFCSEVKFGSKLARTSKPAPTNNTKYFKAPFCFAEYNKKLQNQHSGRWKQYQGADDTGNHTCFENVLPAKETLHTYFGAK